MGGSSLEIFDIGKQHQSFAPAVLIRQESDLLLDCGKINTNTPPIPQLEKIKIQNLDAVLISHAHFDHYGGLPSLMNKGFSGPILMGEITYEIFKSLVKERRGIFRGKFRDWLFENAVPLDYFNPVTVGNFEIEIFPSHHSFDASFTLITDNLGKRKILYTGDLGVRDETFEIEVEICLTLFDATVAYLPAIDDYDILLQDLFEIINAIIQYGLNVSISIFPVPSLEFIQSISMRKRAGLILGNPDLYLDPLSMMVPFLNLFNLNNIQILDYNTKPNYPFIFLKNLNSKRLDRTIEIQIHPNKTGMSVKELQANFGSVDEIPWDKYQKTPLYLPISNHLPRSRIPKLFKNLKSRYAIPIGHAYGKENHFSIWWRENIPNTTLAFFQMPERKYTL